MEASSLARKVAELATADIGVREKGDNDGKRINQYQAAVGIKKGQPYCIAAICCWIREAAAALQVPVQNLLSPSAMRFLEYARKQGYQKYPFDIQPEDIPLVGIIDHGQGKGHAFLIVGMDEDSGALDTIDANSNAMGVRDGQGVVALTGRHYLKDLAGAVRIVWGIKQPTDKTLAKYGIDDIDWLRLAVHQGGVCAICSGLPKSGRLHIDHEHVRGWKRMPPEQRRRYVRGLACFRCNSQFMRRGLTVELAKKVFDYLERYANTSY